MLTGAVSVMLVLGLCLFRRESVGVVTARVTEQIPRVRVEGVPSGSAVSKAVELNVDPDQISFTAVLALTRNLLTADRSPYVNCGDHDPDPIATLTAAIAGQPLNRHDRQRTGPRTPLDARQNVPATSPTR